MIHNGFINIVKDGFFENVLVDEVYNRVVNDGYQILANDVVDDRLIYTDLIMISQTNYDLENIKIKTVKDNVLICSANHIIFTKNKGYIEAGNLEKDDILEIFGVDEPDDFVLLVEKTDERARHNLKVAEPNNYYINNILVQS
jgi:hypothetical protein